MSVQTSLADRLALAIIEHGPLPLDRLARVVNARKADVLRELRLSASPAFEHFGAGRGSRWRVEAPTGSREQMGTEDRPQVMLDDVLDVPERLRALERRVAELELQLADLRVGS